MKLSKSALRRSQGIQAHLHLENSAYSLVPGKLSSLMGVGMKSWLVGLLGRVTGEGALCPSCQIR